MGSFRLEEPKARTRSVRRRQGPSSKDLYVRRTRIGPLPRANSLLPLDGGEAAVDVAGGPGGWGLYIWGRLGSFWPLQIRGLVWLGVLWSEWGGGSTVVMGESLEEDVRPARPAYRATGAVSGHPRSLLLSPFDPPADLKVTTSSFDYIPRYVYTTLALFAVLSSFYTQFFV